MKAYLILFVMVCWACSGVVDNESGKKSDAMQDSLSRVRIAAELAARVDSINGQELREALDYVNGYDLNEHEGYEALHYIETCKLLREYGILAVRHQDSKNAALSKAAKDLKKKIVSLQVRIFPTLRKRWADAAGRKLWEHDIEVRAFGKGNVTLELVGGTFAANANIKATHESIRDGVELLRFKRVNYKWYSGVDEYDYYKIESPSDSEL